MKHILKNFTLAFGILVSCMEVGICETKIIETVVDCLSGHTDKCKNLIDSGVIPPANQCAKLNMCAMGSSAYISMDNDDMASQYWEEIIKLSPSELQQDVGLQVMVKLSKGLIDFIPSQEGTYVDLYRYYSEKEDAFNTARVAALGCNKVTNKEYLAEICAFIVAVTYESKEYHLAYQYAKKVCDLSVTTASTKEVVATACSVLGLLNEEGQGVRQDYYKARTYYQKSCDLGISISCEFLGDLHREGKGGQKSLQTAKRFYGKGCDLGKQSACDKYKTLNQQGVQ